MAKQEQNIEPPPPAEPIAPSSKDPVTQPRHFWAALAVVGLWVAVTVVGVCAKTDLVISSHSTHIEVPVVWGVALFATVATWIITVSAFRRD